jgi:hypothetical protein
VDVENEVWPVTIVPARDGGAYEGGLWLAFPFHPDSLPLDWEADDLVASRYYEEHSHEIGAGESPTEAYENLQRIMRDRRLR